MATFKIVYNDCYGGFSLNDKARAEIVRRKGLDNEEDIFSINETIPRDDEDLVAVVESMCAGKGTGTSLMIKELPACFKGCWRIQEYDGMENVIIDQHRYKLKLIEDIVNCDQSLADKMEDIAAVLAESKERCAGVD